MNFVVLAFSEFLNWVVLNWNWDALGVICNSILVFVLVVIFLNWVVLNWNWDALGVICNSILVLALVLITLWYAKKVSEQTELMVKDRERNKILEEVQDVLTPTILSLKTEIKAIQDNKIFWKRYPSLVGFEKGPSKLLTDNKKDRSGAVKDIFRKFPILEGRFSSHDSLCDKLNDFYAKIESEVKTPELTERLKTLVKEFNESREGSYRISKEHSENPDQIFVYCIINFRYPIERSSDSTLPNITPLPNIIFWEKYKNELLKFRDTAQIKELDKEIEEVLTQLRKLDEELLGKIEEIREDYRVTYNFTKYEIDSELREFERKMKGKI